MPLCPPSLPHRPLHFPPLPWAPHQDALAKFAVGAGPLLKALGLECFFHLEELSIREVCLFPAV